MIRVIQPDYNIIIGFDKETDSVISMDFRDILVKHPDKYNKKYFKKLRKNISKFLTEYWINSNFKK